MGWFWGKNESKPPNSDPLRDLDPSLRDFLSKESPIKYKPAPPPPQQQSPNPTSSQPSTTTSPEPSSDTPHVPSESLYPDGRYAHLWANYKPLSAIEAESKTDQEKLLDVLEGYKERKAQIGRAAVENCVEEQLALNDCYDNGAWKQKMMMCRSENRAFERCYSMQSRFLKALGYLSTYDRPFSVDEAIQMHADTLYHRMLAQEKAVEEAKASNSPIPSFPSILSSSAAAATAADVSPSPTSVPARSTDPKDSKPDLPILSSETQKLLTAASQRALRERMKDMTPAEREVEEQSVIMEGTAASETGRQVAEINELRKKRRAEGKATAGDTISGWFGW
ncbi:hypothetical protein MMC28_009780 [Mycoblastus sanguinarius]|nr:hypothetical protein [Mycoblastus sanguinarius]